MLVLVVPIPEYGHLSPDSSNQTDARLGLLHANDPSEIQVHIQICRLLYDRKA
jgi:hypothetical protein